MSIVWSDHRASNALSYDEKLTAANVKIAALAFELARARAWVKWDVDHSGSESRFGYAFEVLAGIDAALEGTIHSFSKNGPVR